MRKYQDYKDPKYDKLRHFDEELTSEEMKKVEWTKFKIIVPTETDKEELQEAFREIHNSEDFDSDIIALNQLGHLYLTKEDTGGKDQNMIVVDKELFESINEQYPTPNTKDELNEEMETFEAFKSKKKEVEEDWQDKETFTIDGNEFTKGKTKVTIMVDGKKKKGTFHNYNPNNGMVVVMMDEEK